MSRNPRQRDESQTVLAFTLSKELAAELDEFCTKHGLNRSQFIREALAEGLIARGVSLESAAVKAPSRIGKGGAATHKKPGAIIHRGAAKHAQDVRAAAIAAGLHPDAGTTKRKPPADGAGGAEQVTPKVSRKRAA